MTISPVDWLGGRTVPHVNTSPLASGTRAANASACASGPPVSDRENTPSSQSAANRTAASPPAIITMAGVFRQRHGALATNRCADPG